MNGSEDELARVDLTHQGGTVRARITGEIDMSNAEDVHAQVLSASAGAEMIIVDLTGVTFIDSAAIAALDRLNRELAGGSTALRVEAAGDSVVARTLILAGMDRVLPLATEQTS